jgi:hypothetical protein
MIRLQRSLPLPLAFSRCLPRTAAQRRALPATCEFIDDRPGKPFQLPGGKILVCRTISIANDRYMFPSCLSAIEDDSA